MRVLSLCPLSVLPCSPLEQIDAAHSARFDAVGLRLFPVVETDIDVMADAGLRSDIRRRLAALNMRVLDIEVMRLTPDTDVSAVAPVLAYASDLGARMLTVTAAPRAEWRASDEPVVAQKFGELCELALRHGVKPMIEFMVFRGIATLQDAARMVERANHPNLGICLDVLHLYRSGGTVESVRAVDPKLIDYVQLCDAPLADPPAAEIPKEARFGRLPPGEGGLPLAELLAAVPADVAVGVEVPSLAMSDKSVLERAIAMERSSRQVMDAEAALRGPV